MEHISWAPFPGPSLEVARFASSVPGSPSLPLSASWLHHDWGFHIAHSLCFCFSIYLFWGIVEKKRDQKSLIPHFKLGSLTRVL